MKGERIIKLPDASSAGYADDPYTKLAHAVVLAAVHDYRRVCRELNSCLSPTGVRKLRKEKNDLERFFRSGWFQMLSGFDEELTGSVRARIIREAKEHGEPHQQEVIRKAQ